MSEKESAAVRRAEYVEALKIEREGYERAGKADRVKQVDDQLAKYGEAPRRNREPETRTAKKPTKRG